MNNVETFVEFCERELDLKRKEMYCYRSLSVCLLDSVYSLMNHYSSCEKTVGKYVDRYMSGDKTKEGDTLSSLVANMDAAGGPVDFALNVLNSGKKAGSTGLYRAEVVYNLAKHLIGLGIDTIEDFRNFEDEELLSKEMMKVKGIGMQASNYLFMLAGDTGRVKKDVHIDQFLSDLFPGQTFTNEECLALFQDTVSVLNEKYPDITVRSLDGMIWTRYR